MSFTPPRKTAPLHGRGQSPSYRVPRKIRILFDFSTSHLLQDNLPGVKPFEVGDSQQGVKDPADHNGQGKRDAEAVEQLEGFVLLGKRPDMEEKGRVSLPNF